MSLLPPSDKYFTVVVPACTYFVFISCLYTYLIFIQCLLTDFIHFFNACGQTRLLFRAYIHICDMSVVPLYKYDMFYIHI